MNVRTDPALEALVGCYEAGEIVVLPTTVCTVDPENSVKYHAGLYEELDAMFPGLEESFLDGRASKSSIVYFGARSEVYPLLRAVQLSTSLPMVPQVELLASARDILLATLGEGKRVNVFLPDTLSGGTILKAFLKHVDVDDDRMTLWTSGY